MAVVSLAAIGLGSRARTGGGDLLRAEPTIVGPEGADSLIGHEGADRLDGGEGNDVFGTAGRDQLLGGDGDDVIAGHHDADRLVRGPGDDALVDAGEGVDGLRGMRIVSLPSPPGTEGQGDTCSTATGRRTPARAGQGRTSA